MFAAVPICCCAARLASARKENPRPAFRLSPQAGLRGLAAFGGLSLLAALGLTAVRPAHSAGGPIPVTVSNSPLLTTAADDHDKQGVQHLARIVIRKGDYSGFDNSYVVPAGKRLVIEGISAFSGYNINHYTVVCSTQGGLNNSVAETSFSVLPDGAVYSSGNAQSHLYADAGTSVDLQAARTEAADPAAGVDVSFFGYLADMP